MPRLFRVQPTWVTGSLLVAHLLFAFPAVAGQVLIDRVLARVNGMPVTLTDVRAGLGLGLVVAREDEMDLATEQWIQRQLLLLEVERFPPPEPAEVVIAQEVERMMARVGSLAALAARTGVDDRQVRQSARDTLRIRAYLDQRFGAGLQVSDEDVRAYYASRQTEFMRGGVVLPFEQVEAEARRRVAAVSRQTTIDQWMGELRQRSDVVMNRP